jgi:acid phosphatase
MERGEEVAGHSRKGNYRVRKHWIQFVAVFVLCAVFPAAAPIAAQVVAPLAPGERIANLGTLKQQLRDYHDCVRPMVCYQSDLDLEARRAIAFLRRRAAHVRSGEKLALVLDIDETALSNYEELESGNFEWNQARFDAWVDSGKALAIPGTLRLAQAAQKLGVSVFVITGRPESQREATEKNLRAAGFDHWQELILRGSADAKTTALVYKSAARGRIAAEGYRIVLNVGDQWSDLRGSPMAEFSVKYPDPFYFVP